jgi:hypothetical protein
MGRGVRAAVSGGDVDDADVEVGDVVDRVHRFKQLIDLHPEVEVDGGHEHRRDDHRVEILPAASWLLSPLRNPSPCWSGAQSPHRVGRDGGRIGDTTDQEEWTWTDRHWLAQGSPALSPDWG